MLCKRVRWVIKAECVVCFDPRSVPALVSLRWRKRLSDFSKCIFVFAFLNKMQPHDQMLYHNLHPATLCALKVWDCISWMWNCLSMLTGWQPERSVHTEGHQGAPWQSHLWRQTCSSSKGKYPPTHPPINKWINELKEKEKKTLDGLKSEDADRGRSCVFPKEKEATLFTFTFHFFACSCNTLRNAFTTTAVESIQPLGRDSLMHLAQWIYTLASVLIVPSECMQMEVHLSCHCCFNHAPLLISKMIGKKERKKRLKQARVEQWIKVVYLALVACVPVPPNITLCTHPLLLPPLPPSASCSALPSELTIQPPH